MRVNPTILVDTREQTPWAFTLPTERATMRTGDYSVSGLEHLIAIERKSLADFVACCGYGRDRFVRELERLRGVRYRCVIIEADLATIEAGDWRGKLTPNHILGAIASWPAKYLVSFYLAGNAASAARLAERFLTASARHIADTYRNAAKFLEAGAAR